MDPPVLADCLNPDLKVKANELFLKGREQHAQGLIAEASELYRRSLQLDPHFFKPIHLLGVIALQQGDTTAALALIRQAIALDDTYASAHDNLGNALRLIGDARSAVASYQRAIALNPQQPLPYLNLGLAHAALHEHGTALRCYGQCLALQPDYPPAFNNRGNSLRSLQRYEEAISDFEKAVALSPSFVEAHLNLGACLQDVARDEQALKCYETALNLEPDNPVARRNQGLALFSLRRFDAALDSFNQALSQRPNEAELYNDRGNVFRALGQLSEALSDYNLAIVKAPNDAKLYANQAAIHEARKDYGLAIACYSQALALEPDYPYLRGARLFARRQIADWTDDEAELAVVLNDLKSATPANLLWPFTALALTDRLDLQAMAARQWCEAQAGTTPRIMISPVAGRRIRLGYFSCDYFNHATCHLMAGLFEAHDKTHFELYAFSYGRPHHDEMRARVQQAFDHFIEVDDLSDEAIAALSRQSGIDIAIDLKGYTSGHRAGIFAHGAAPVQVSYLGHPGPLGSPNIDYVIADKIVIPPDKAALYRERVAYLPDCYQPNGVLTPLAQTPRTRRDYGLPDTGFVYCCFNHSYKITPARFATWMRILKATPGSVLWLLTDTQSLMDNLKAQANAHHIDPKRLIFAPRVAVEEHLARHAYADLFLDTLPYNAHTTASDALRCGVPVLTLPGDAFASRVAASLLRSLRLTDLIVANEAAYEALAITLAEDPKTLSVLREQLIANLSTSSLYNPITLTRALENLYQQMMQRALQGLPAKTLGL